MTMEWGWGAPGRCEDVWKRWPAGLLRRARAARAPAPCIGFDLRLSRASPPDDADAEREVTRVGSARPLRCRDGASARAGQDGPQHFMCME